MGAFVLGVLIGWLIAWVFYTFWIKPTQTNDESASLKEQLELKNRQISSLQSQISASDETSVSNTANLKKTTTMASAANKPSSSKTTSAKAKLNKKPATTIKKPTRKTKTTAKKAQSKTTAKQTKVQPKKAATTKDTMVKKALEKKSVTASTKTMESAKSIGDDFTKLSGIGPSMSATLKSLDIDTFEKLAAMDNDVLRELLEKSGAKMNSNKGVMDSWNEQATLAAKGDFTSLKQLQQNMKK